MRSLRGWRRLVAVLLALTGLVAVGLMLPNTATAIPGLSDCKDAPTPEVPGRGVEGFFQPAPASPPKAGDPFAANATTSIYEQYGYAGLRWSTYDLGCAGAAGSPEASVGTTVANWLFTVPKAVVAATGAMLGAAYQPQFLSVFDPLLTTVVNALQQSVFQQWAGLVLAGLGFLIVWRARRSSLSSTAAALGWALFVMVLATALFRWPLAAGQAADTTLTSTMSTVTAALNQHDSAGNTSTGTSAVANLHHALLYQAWLGGEFGDANSVAARKYGAQLFDAQALTWAQAATLSQDPAAGQRIIEAKQATFKQVAAAVKAEDPDAYEYLSGRRSDARIGFASLSLLAVACAVPFLLISSLLMIGALVITRFAVMLFPVIATLALFPTMRSLVIGVGNTVAAALINALVFGIGTAVMVTAYGVVMAPGNGLPSWLVVALVLLLTLVMWYMLRPFHRLTTMASPGRSPLAGAAGAVGGVTRGVGRAGGAVVTTTAGVLLGEDAAKAEKDSGKAGKDAGRPRLEADPQTVPEADAAGDGTGAGTPTGDGAGAGGAGAGGAGTGGAVAVPGPNRRWWAGRRERAGQAPPLAEGVDPDVAAVASAAAGTSASAARSASGELVAAEVGLPQPRLPRSRPSSAVAARPVVRRSEDADLDDVAAWPVPRGDGGAAADLNADDADSLYRPDLYRPDER